MSALSAALTPFVIMAMPAMCQHLMFTDLFINDSNAVWIQLIAAAHRMAALGNQVPTSLQQTIDQRALPFGLYAF